MPLSVQNVGGQNTLISKTNKVDIPAREVSFRSQLEAYLDTRPASTNANNTVRDAIEHNAAVDNINRSLDKSRDKSLVVKESDWIDLKPEDYSMEKFREKIAYANYVQGLLNPEILPRWVSKPEAGISRSTDMVSPPTFEEAVGGVYRIDHTISGKVRTYIPSYEWRKTGTAKNDAALGDVYNQQTPWGFRTTFIRDGSGRTPVGYKEGTYKNEITAFLDSRTSTDASKTASSKYQASPPAELDWQERLAFYNNPARYLLTCLTISRTNQPFYNNH